MHAEWHQVLTDKGQVAQILDPLPVVLALLLWVPVLERVDVQTVQSCESRSEPQSARELVSALAAGWGRGGM